MPLRMGPSDSTPTSQRSSAPNPNSTSTSTSSEPKPTLPPEALDLATRFFNAARTGDVAILQQAIAAGLPVNLTNDKGDTLLMLSSYHTHAPLVQYLLSQNADPNTLNDRGQSPLAGAVFKAAGGVRGMSALRNGGEEHRNGQADGAGGGGGGETEGQAEGGREEVEGTSEADEIIEMLLDAGADVDKGRPSAKESVEMFRVERWKGRICGGIAGGGGSVGVEDDGE
ncbi:MAG: hypothetical protein Q9215_005303 [Flavoplaca cf. flavocitrina]